MGKIAWQSVSDSLDLWRINIQQSPPSPKTDRPKNIPTLASFSALISESLRFFVLSSLMMVLSTSPKMLLSLYFLILTKPI